MHKIRSGTIDAVKCAQTVRNKGKISNDLLNYKGFIFRSFKFDDFKDPITVPGGEIKWKFFHDVHEKDALLDANLRKRPKLTTKVIQPGNCKYHVLTALAIFHEKNAAAIQSYFPDQKSTVEFLRLLGKWWVISNSKTAFSTKHLPWKRSN